MKSVAASLKGKNRHIDLIDSVYNEAKILIKDLKP
jgi:hypothetical protein